MCKVHHRKTYRGKREPNPSNIQLSIFMKCFEIHSDVIVTELRYGISIKGGLNEWRAWQYKSWNRRIWTREENEWLSACTLFVPSLWFANATQYRVVYLRRCQAKAEPLSRVYRVYPSQ